MVRAETFKHKYLAIKDARIRDVIDEVDDYDLLTLLWNAAAWVPAVLVLLNDETLSFMNS